MAVDVAVAPGGAALRLGTPHPLFVTQVPRAVSGFRYDISHDGKRFLLFVPSAETSSAPIHVVANWGGGATKVNRR